MFPLTKKIMITKKRHRKIMSSFIGCSFAILIYIAFILPINPLCRIDSTKNETKNENKSILSKLRSELLSKMITEKTLEVERNIFLLTNRIRAEYNLKSFKLDPILSDVARSHSLDMAKRNFFSHINPEGKTPTDRAREKGFRVKRFLNHKSYIENIAENIGKMPTGLVLYRGYVEDTPEAVAKALMKSWMVRPGHRTNIINYISIKIGIGVAFDGTYYFATQNFH